MNDQIILALFSFVETVMKCIAISFVAYVKIHELKSLHK